MCVPIHRKNLHWCKTLTKCYTYSKSLHKLLHKQCARKDVYLVSVTVDKWYLPLVFVTRLAFPPIGKTQMTEKMAHPATLTILGSKVSTCFRRAFMVFPVSTMALGKGRAKEQGEMKREAHLSAEWFERGDKWLPNINPG